MDLLNPSCRKCGSLINRPVVIRKKRIYANKEVIEDVPVLSEFRCQCGKSSFSGEIEKSQIDLTNKVTIDTTEMF